MYLKRRTLLLGGIFAGTGVIVGAQSPRLSNLLWPSQSLVPSGRIINVQDFGARGDARTDDTAAIQTAIDSVTGSGGGTVRFPAGTYLVSRSESSAVAVSLRSGVLLKGAGHNSVLKLREGSGGHLVNITRAKNCGMRNLILDGNRDQQPSTGHGLRSGGVDGLSLENIIVRNAFHYGIGLQAGENRNVLIRDVLIHDCGGDGIDIKNKASSDGIVRIENVTVRRWGLRTDRLTQAAIDCRGGVHMSNIRVTDPGAEDAVGIRMRHGEASDVHGCGAHGSQLASFNIRMGSGSAQIGIAVSARDVTVRDGAIYGGRRGLIIQDSGFQGSSLQVLACSEMGILVDAHGSSLDGDSAALHKCRVSGCGGNGFEVEADDVELVDCHSVGNRGFGLLIKETASRTWMVGGSYAENRRGAIIDRGLNSRVQTVTS